MPVPGSVFCEMIKTQIRAAEERDDRWQLVLKCCGRELQGWLVLSVRD